MCGIIGFVNPNGRAEGKKRKEFLHQGLIVDALRGWNGTGIGAVTPKGQVEVYRKALPGPDFVNSTVYDIAMQNMDEALIAIGHNRAATIGSTKDKNCHPFYFEGKRKILLVHNGTLHSHTKLTPNTFYHDVDSAHAAYALANDDDVGETLRSVRGPFVFVWWDGTANTFNIARNEMRDIYFVHSDAGELFFGSEFRMVDWLLDRCGIVVPDGEKYRYPGDHQWWSWSVDPKTHVIGKPHVTPILPTKPSWNWAGNGRGTEPLPIPEFDKFLKDMVLDKGDKIVCEILRWEPYNHNMVTGNPQHLFGKLILCAKDEQDEPTCWVHSVSQERSEFYIKNFKNEFPVRIERVQWSRDPLKPVTDKVLVCDIKLTDLAKQVKKAKIKNLDLRNQLNEEIKSQKRNPSETHFIRGPNQGLIPESIWCDYTKAGCAVCSDIPTLDEAEEIEWIPNAQPPSHLCKVCRADNDCREMAGLDKINESTAVAIVQKDGTVVLPKVH